MDAGKAGRVLDALMSRFEQLTQRAQTYIASLQTSLELQTADLEHFVAYKQMLVDYLERFIQELVVRGAEIGRLLEETEAGDMRLLLDLAAERELADALEVTPERRQTVRDRWARQWRGCGAGFWRRRADGRRRRSFAPMLAGRFLPGCGRFTRSTNVGSSAAIAWRTGAPWGGGSHFVPMTAAPINCGGRHSPWRRLGTCRLRARRWTSGTSKRRRRR